MEYTLKGSLQQEAAFRQVYDETQSYFKQTRRNDRGVALEPAKLFLMQRVPREDTETSVYVYPHEYLIVDDVGATSVRKFDKVNDMTEDILDTWGIEERDEEDMKKAIVPHPALQKQFKLLIRNLEADLLGKLAIVGVKNYDVKRQLQIERLGKQMRAVLASLPVAQSKIVNFIFLENLPKELLTSYMEGLRTVRFRWPMYVEELLAGDTAPYLKRMNISQIKQFVATTPPEVTVPLVPKLEKVQPVMIVIPHCEGDTSRRFLAFMDLMRGFCEVKIMPPIRLPKQPSPETDPARSVQEFLCSEIKHIHLLRPKTPIFVLGWGTGASLAAPSISPSLGSARGFVSLAMPLQGCHGRRGYCEDKLINALATPTLFVTGAISQRATPSQYELVRSRLSVESRLLIIGGADHLLRLTARWKWQYSVTQAQVDRQIVMEIRSFVLHLLGGPPSKNANNSSPTNPNARSQTSSSASSSAQGRESAGGGGGHYGGHFPSSGPPPSRQPNAFHGHHYMHMSHGGGPSGQHYGQSSYGGPSMANSGAFHGGQRGAGGGPGPRGRNAGPSPGRGGMPMGAQGGPNMRGRSLYRRGGRRGVAGFRGGRHASGGGGGGERRGWREPGGGGGPMQGSGQAMYRHHPYEPSGTAIYRQAGQQRGHHQFHNSGRGGRNMVPPGVRPPPSSGPASGPMAREIDNSYDQETAAAIQSIT